MTDTPFPTSPRVVFERNPLREVVCQLRFPPILQIVAEEPAEFQKRVRGTYPNYEKDDGTTWPEELRPLLRQLPLPLGTDTVTHRFLTEDRGRVISLGQDFVATSESHYHRWEQFRQEIRLAKDTAEAVYAPSFYSRVGLRYRNVIDPTELGLEGVSWAQLLKPAFAGILTVPNLADHIRQKNVQFLMDLGQSGNCFVTVRHGLQPKDDASPVYFIDADFFTTAKEGGDNVLVILDRFHQQAGQFFRWAIQERLSDALRPLPVS